jgi:hypothetical protein
MSVLQSSVNWVIAQAKARLGLDYDYGQCYSPTDLSQGGDCSGVGGWVLQAFVLLPANIPVWANGQWAHAVSTESWAPGAPPGTVGPYGTIAVANLGDIPADAALTINIMHGPGGGENSHMNVVVPLPGSLPYKGVIVESNGDYGSCTNGTGAYAADASLWTDHHYLPGPWIPDVPPGEAPPAPPTAHTYTVQSGDTLADIADRLGVTLAALEAANPQVTDANLIYPGQVLTVP